jgi:hypothetical protein
MSMPSRSESSTRESDQDGVDTLNGLIATGAMVAVGCAVVVSVVRAVLLATGRIIFRRDESIAVAVKLRDDLRAPGV